MTRRPRVAIVHDGFVPAYRVPLFERLAFASDVDYVVFHSEPGDEVRHVAAGGPFDFPNRLVRRREVRVAGRSVLHQSLVREIVRGYDAVVLGAWMRFSSTHAVRAAFEVLDRPVVYWGHGGHVTHDAEGLPRPIVHVREQVKLRLARSVDAYLAYTAGSAAKLVEKGVPARRVFALGNTIDMDAQAALRAQVQEIGDARVREELGIGPGTRVVVCLGRLIADKRVDDLLAVAERVNRDRAEPIEFAVIGDGPARAGLEHRAASLLGVRMLGRLDDLAVAKWLACASALALPGRVGLAANHAFAHGVPAVCRATDLNSPEVEYVEHGRNGLVVDGGADAFADVLVDLVDSPDWQRKLAAGALTAAGSLDLDPMVRAFDGGVRYALRAHGLSARQADIALARAS